MSKLCLVNPYLISVTEMPTQVHLLSSCCLGIVNLGVLHETVRLHGLRHQRR